MTLNNSSQRLSRTIRMVFALLAGILVAVCLTPSGPASAAVNITVATHNTKRGAASFQPHASVIGWQEVENTTAHNKLSALGGYAHFLPYPDLNHPGNSIPISWRTDVWDKTGGGSRLTHGGEDNVTPARYVNWVVLKHKGSGKKIVFVNTHFINGAWNGVNPNNRERWLIHDAALRDELGQLRAKGFPIIVVGDFNRNEAMNYGGMEYLEVQGGGGVPFDHIYASSSIAGPGKNCTRLGEFGSDHNAYTAAFQI